MRIKSGRLISAVIVMLFLTMLAGTGSADKVNVELVDHFGGKYDTRGGSNIAFSGNYAYVAAGTRGLVILDISDPLSPIFINTFNTPHYIGGVTVSGNYAMGVTVSGNYAYVSDSTGRLVILDISDPSSPIITSISDPSLHAIGKVAVSDNYAYIAYGSGGLFIRDISNPSSPTITGKYNTPGTACGVAVLGNYAYVADGVSGLLILDISDPSSPTLVGTYDIPGYAYDVAISSNYAYVADRNGLVILDISDPSSPTLGGYDSGYTYGVAVRGNYAYLSSGRRVFTILKTERIPYDSDYLNISTQINDGYAITTVEEKLDNKNNFSVKGDFEYLIPEKAFLSGFSVIMDGEEHIADVLKRTDVQQEAEETMLKKVSMVLLNNRDSQFLSYPLTFEANQSITIRLTYEQALVRTSDTYEYQEYLRNHDAVNGLSVTVDINSSTDILSVDVPGFEAEVEYPDDRRAHVSYTSSDIPGQNMRVIFQTENTPLNGKMLFYESDGEGYFMHIFHPTAVELETTASTPLISNLTFSYDGLVSQTVLTGGEELLPGSEITLLGKYDFVMETITSRITGDTREAERAFEYEFSVKPQPYNAFVERRWAYSTIRNRLDRMRVEGETDELVGDVTTLSLEYGFVTPYTSFFIEVPRPESSEEEIDGEMPTEQVQAFERGYMEEVVEDEYSEEVVEDEGETQSQGLPGFGIVLALSSVGCMALALRSRMR